MTTTAFADVGYGLFANPGMSHQSQSQLQPQLPTQPQPTRATPTVGAVQFPDPRLAEAYGSLQGMVQNGSITITNWMPLVVKLMGVAAKCHTLSGFQKKAFVLDTALRLLREIPLTCEEQAPFLAMASPVISGTIDAVYDAQQGRFNLGLSVKTTFMALVQQYESEAVFQTLYAEIRGAIVESHVSAALLLSVGPRAMAAGRRLVKVPGPEKKKIVLALLQKLATELPIASGSERAALDLALQTMLPATIDIVYAAASGRLPDIVKRCTGCLPCK
jgi:hypothetical protein